MMMMMKNPIVLVACIFLFSSLAVFASQSSFGPDECCFQFFSTKLPKNRVVSYKYTDRRCSMKAVLFTMRNRAQICVNPSELWVKDIIAAKDWELAKEAPAPNNPTHPPFASTPHLKAQ